MTYRVQEHTIHAQHHYAPGRITACARVYDKQTGSVDLTVTDPFAPPVRPSQLEADLRTVVQMEKDCIAAVKAMQRAMSDVLRLRTRCVCVLARAVHVRAAPSSHRAAASASTANVCVCRRRFDVRRQEMEVSLEKTVFETARERARTGLIHDDSKESVDASAKKKVDFLAPFLQLAQDPRRITKVACSATRTACLRWCPSMRPVDALSVDPSTRGCALAPLRVLL